MVATAGAGVGGTPKTLFCNADQVCPRCWGRKLEPGARKTVCTYCTGNGVIEDRELAPNFFLSELVRSEGAARRGIPNNPSEAQIENLRKTATALSLIRSQVGPIRVNSGLRLPAVNVAIGGSETSAHMDGNAADWVPADSQWTLRGAAKAVVGLMDNGDLHVDQFIYEGTWLHIGIVGARGKVRGQKLMMFGGKYFPLDLNDPRVV